MYVISTNGKYQIMDTVGREHTLVKAVGVPHSELNITLWRGWYQKSYPNLVTSSLHLPFTCM